MYEGSWTKKLSLSEVIEALIEKIDKERESSKQPESMEVDNVDQPRWKAWVAKLNKAIKDFGEKGGKVLPDSKLINKRSRMRDYLEEVRALLKEKKAKTWNEIHPDPDRKENCDDTRSRETLKSPSGTVPFQVWSSDWWAVPVSQEKVSLYEELYEACWNGDDDKIHELCLPESESTTRKVAPIQIVCKTTEGGEPHLN